MNQKSMISIIIYVILVFVFGFLIMNYLTKPILIEGARTLPRPVINPPVKKEEEKTKPLIFKPDETMNEYIDRFVVKYFDKDGLPLESTILLYINYCVNKGNVTMENKQKLTDIGYYLLNIFIPNLPRVDNPDPKEHWPPIQWSNHKIFDVLIAPTNTYKTFRGQNYLDSYASAYQGSQSGGGGNFLNMFGMDFNNYFGYGGEYQKEKASSGNNESGDGSECSESPESKCGIGCPTSCLSSAFAPYLNNNSEGDNNKSSGGSSDGQGFNDNDSGSNNANNQLGQQSNTGGTVFLPGGENVLVIGSANIDGYVITDEKQKSDDSILNDQIDEFISDYFINLGPNQNKPTQKMIDLFNMLKEKQPMDNIHMNKMRDIVFYVLQVIIPGLPTRALPRSYVEWRPIVWLSRSEKSK